VRGESIGHATPSPADGQGVSVAETWRNATTARHGAESAVPSTFSPRATMRSHPWIQNYHSEALSP